MATAPGQDAAYRFAGFSLVPARAALSGPDGAAIELRPKSYAVLLNLVRNTGRLVTREALLDAVWPDVTVGEESLTQCVSDVRRALGDRGATLVRTLPRRGYMLDTVVEVGTLEESGRSLPAPEGDASGPPRPEPEATYPGGTAPTSLAYAPLRVKAPGSAIAGVAAVFLALGAWSLLQDTDVPSHSSAAAAAAGVDSPGAFTSLATSPRERAQALYQKGRRSLVDEWSPAAVLGQRDLYQQSVMVDPTFAPAWTALAFSYAYSLSAWWSLDRVEDLRLGTQAVERALALKPEDTGAYSALGLLLLQQPERLEEALVTYQRVLALSSSLYWARANIGYLLTLLGRPDEAEAHVRAALATAPDDARFDRRAHYYLGIIELHLGRGDQGVANLQVCRGCDGREHGLLYLAAALAQAGQLAEARMLVAEVRQRRPELTIDMLRAEAPSRHPAYLAQRERMLEGVTSAGLPE